MEARVSAELCSHPLSVNSGPLLSNQMGKNLIPRFLLAMAIVILTRTVFPRVFTAMAKAIATTITMVFLTNKKTKMVMVSPIIWKTMMMTTMVFLIRKGLVVFN